MTLLIHTSSPTVHVGLADGDRIVARDEFLGDRSLAETIAERVSALLKAYSSQLKDLGRIVVHAGPASATFRPRPFDVTQGAPSRVEGRAQGRGGATAGRPGGFTTLRIGVTTANTLAYALNIPIVGVTGEIPDLAILLARGKDAPAAARHCVLPVYAKAPHIGPVPGRP